MKAFSAKRPILAGMIIAVFFLLMLQVIGLFVGWTVPYDGGYLQTMAAEFLSALLAVGIALIFGRLSCLKRCKKGFFRSFVPCAYFLGVFGFTLITTLLSNIGTELNPPLHIAIFLIAMMLIGVTEEIVFRGVIASMIFDKYSKDRAGVWYSVMMSGVIFGVGHLGNVFAGGEFSGVLVQTVLAVAVGMVYTAIYYRTGNIWTMIILHGLNDVVALFASGFFVGGGSISDTINTYNVTMYAPLAAYAGIMLLLLRPSKMCSDILGGEKLLPSQEASKVRMFKAITFICGGITCCIIYGFIAMFS